MPLLMSKNHEWAADLYAPCMPADNALVSLGTRDSMWSHIPSTNALTLLVAATNVELRGRGRLVLNEAWLSTTGIDRHLGPLYNLGVG